MFIIKAEYDTMYMRIHNAEENCNRLNETIKANNLIIKGLEKEVTELSGIINFINTKDCKMGSWCKDCKYYYKQRAFTTNEIAAYADKAKYINLRAGEVEYCKKHIKEICPDYIKIDVEGNDR